jgi:hypothetical protein
VKNEAVSALLKNKKTLVLLAAAVIIGILMMIFGGRGKNEAETDEISEYEESTENKIEQTVQAMCGGKVYVIVSAEYGKETQYAKNVTESGEQTVISSGAPVTVRTAAPVIRGITVVCRNGGDPSAARRITEALSCAYGISSARIYVTSYRQ